MNKLSTLRAIRRHVTGMSREGREGNFGHSEQLRALFWVTPRIQFAKLLAGVSRKSALGLFGWPRLALSPSSRSCKNFELNSYVGIERAMASLQGLYRTRRRRPLHYCRCRGGVRGVPYKGSTDIEEMMRAETFFFLSAQTSLQSSVTGAGEGEKRERWCVLKNRDATQTRGVKSKRETIKKKDTEARREDSIQLWRRQRPRKRRWCL